MKTALAILLATGTLAAGVAFSAQSSTKVVEVYKTPT
jgi:hypothetical protein